MRAERPSATTRRRLLLGGAAGSATAVGAWALLSGRLTRPEPAPDVGYVRMDGRPARLADLRGQVVLVNFWATTCTICRHEMPDLIALQQRLAPRGYLTLSVAMAYDAPAAVMNYLEARPLPFEVTLDNTGAIARAFGGVAGTPTSVLIDRAGRIVWRHAGAPDFAALERRIGELLDAPPQA